MRSLKDGSRRRGLGRFNKLKDGMGKRVRLITAGKGHGMEFLEGRAGKETMMVPQAHGGGTSSPWGKGHRGIERGSGRSIGKKDQGT